MSLRFFPVAAPVALALLACTHEATQVASARRIRDVQRSEAGLLGASVPNWNPIDVNAMTKDQIKGFGAISAGVVSNVLGIPLDGFRVRVAGDTPQKGVFQKSFLNHWRATMESPKAAFTGALARVWMKQMAAFLNMSVPAELKEESPFLAAAGVGFVAAPVLNVPRLLQLGKVAGDSYGAVFRQFFTSPAGLRSYAANTAMFAPGEAFRMMMCFGTKDKLMPLVGGNEDPSNIENIPLFTFKMAGIVGPLVAVVETGAALATETATTIHAKTLGAGGKSFEQALREAVTPAYAKRCGASMLLKNIGANSSLFWGMFLTDFYGKRHDLDHGEAQ